ncbi:MAG TPA: universal stress protein [Ktedonobacteraceae bacterium]|nr:universal stress protein [Ktedonobacteraceae bacterium]
MFNRVLVPLDGSELSEQALPIAARIARASHSSLLLLRVVSTLSEVGIAAREPSVLLQEILEADLAVASAYLARIAGTKELAGIQTGIAVFSGQPASYILDVAEEQHCDLIVMNSHGATGIARWAMGSVTRKVVRHSSIPILVLRAKSAQPQESAPGSVHPVRALVALDGSTFAEAALLPAAHLVRALSAPAPGALHLIRLVKPLTFEEELFYQDYADALHARQEAVREAGNYMQALTERISSEEGLARGVNVSWSVEEGNDVAQALITIAESGKGIATREASDLIALTTHGRSGLERWLMGSVTERVLDGTKLPLLVVRPQPLAAAPPQKKEKTVYLHDILRVCLLAVANRYPEHSIDVEAVLLNRFSGERKGWRAEELIRWLEALDPALLEQGATLLIDENTCGIYLPEYSQEEPAFHLHCRGRIPVPREHDTVLQGERR